ncbi:MAG: glycine oxidase ThiO [Nitrospirae bacterium]|nr:glycine oxidase ThiO [Nitrospirota bacterium]
MAATARGADVLIVGGGIIGTLTAIALAGRGVAVRVIERGEPMRESSWAGAGILSPIYPWKYPDALSHLVNRSLALYPALVAELRGASGVDPQYRVSGLIIPVYSAAEWAELAGALPWSQRFGWPARRLDGDQARQVEPCLSERVVGAIDWPQVGQIRNPRLAAAARATAEARGVVFDTGREVTGFAFQGDNGVTVRTASGDLHGSRVLLAAGSWTGGLAERAGFTLPVAPVKGQILLLKTAPGTLTRIVKHDQAYLVPRADGHVLVGATMEMAGFDRRTTLEALHFLSGALLDMAPGLADAEVVRHWMGFRPGTPDGLPYLGPVPGRPGLFVAAGHYRNGVILAPATADAMARMLCGEACPVDLSAFAPERPALAHAALGFPA